jgi:hypothetical protein
MKKVLLGIGVLGIVVIIVLGYYGFIPGLSNIMGINKPKNLGITYSTSDLDSIYEKAQVTFTNLPSNSPPGSSEEVSGSQSIQITVTDEELTAMLNDHSRKWKYYPLTDIELKIEEDGTVKMSGVLIIDRLDGYMEETGLASGYEDQINRYKGIFKSNPKFYGEWDMQIIEGQVVGDVNKFQIGNFNLNQNQIDQYEGQLHGMIEERLGQLGITVNSVTTENCDMVFDGTIPTHVAVATP